jgi:hypothetical protein
MIFSSLFKTKAKWQHKDTAVRIAAINNELSTDNAEQQLILTDIIQQDTSDLVRRAALIKVASFDCYLTQSQDNSQEKVKQFAAKQVHDILAAEHSIVLTTEQKENLLAKQAQSPLFSTALLEAWLANEKDSTLIIALYQQVSARKTTSHLLSHTFSQKQNAELQAYLLAQVSDAKILDKLSKKACNEDIANQIQEKLAAIQAANEKPLKLTKQIQLVLSKLQALKDINDYADYQKRKSVLIQEWQALENDLVIFSADERTVFNNKYQNIIVQLEKLFIAKAENYQQQIIADKLAHDKQQDKKTFTGQLSSISQALTTAVFSSEHLNEAMFKEQLNLLSAEISTSVLNEIEQKGFVKQVAILSQRLDKIPEIAESVSQATLLISKISQLALPKTIEELNARQQTYNDWLKEWRSIEIKTAGVLPTSIVDAHKQIVSTWQGGLKSLQSQQKELFFQQKKKLQDIKRLLNNGKYKVCFGLFKGVKESFEDLSLQQKQQLQRDFDQVNEKMVELSDWEHYIATPRKQELLLAIESLVNTPLDNPNEQAAKVKEYRNTWNSLGHADENVDKELNEQFNLLCEQAFAPCRLFYAEQDKLREQHLAQRLKIIKQADIMANALNNTQTENPEQIIDYKELDGKLNSLQQEWKNTGEVDRNQYKKLQLQFKNAISPIRSAISAFHLSNSNAKKALIVKAEQLTTSEDVFSAIEAVKGLQQTWRTIGFAGNHQESQLWQKFRHVNDELFAKRQQLKTEQQIAQSSQQLAFEKQVAVFEIAFKDIVESNDNKALTPIKLEVDALLTHVLANKPIIKVVAHRLESLLKEIDRLSKRNMENQLKQSWYNLFELMTLHATETLDSTAIVNFEQFKKLTTFWQKRIIEQVKLTEQVEGNSRLDKTLEIEILAQAESPKTLAAQRLQVQVKLMQDQMLSGNEIDISSLLVEWLMLGKLNVSELPLIDRLQSVYCK